MAMKKAQTIATSMALGDHNHKGSNNNNNDVRQSQP
jgi:hypothetical protein